MEKRQASKFYPHFNVNERPTIDKLVGLFNNLVFKQEDILTDFLDPAEIDIMTAIAGNEAYLQAYGGYKNAEKQRLIISLDWSFRNPDDFNIQPFQFNYPSKFAHLTHSSILGTLANSGVETNTFGDIITDGDGIWQFFAKKDFTDFFAEQIDRIGRTKVSLEPISRKEIIDPLDDSIEKSVIASSLRIDAVLSKISNQSRGQIKSQIESGNVKLNWHDIDNSNIIVSVYDVLSLRHFGRIQLVNITSTKKGKYRVVLKLWQTKKRI